LGRNIFDKDLEASQNQGMKFLIIVFCFMLLESAFAQPMPGSEKKCKQLKVQADSQRGEITKCESDADCVYATNLWWTPLMKCGAAVNKKANPTRMEKLAKEFRKICSQTVNTCKDPAIAPICFKGACLQGNAK
jgi:hypothetical protein